MPLSAVELLAPAKINLTLHVVGRRADGYHLLDSLVAFADVGDVIGLSDAHESRLHVSGPFRQGVPEGDDNLMLRAVRLMGARADMTLSKVLPVGAGIGGGSSDAAAVLRGLAAMKGLTVPDAASLGADVPVCVAGYPARMGGVGEVLHGVPPLPRLPIVLVFPDVMVSTPAVFSALNNAHRAPMPNEIPKWKDANDAAVWLRDQRNDLEGAAVGIAPAIAEALEELAESRDCLLARMSGSGSTVFGIFPSEEAARRAAERIAADWPRWWVRPTRLLATPSAVQERRLTT